VKLDVDVMTMPIAWPFAALMCLSLASTWPFRTCAQDVVTQTAAHPGFAPVAQRMLELWSYGCLIHSAASQQLKALAASLCRTDPVLQSLR
jgi:hypothetical protein